MVVYPKLTCPDFRTHELPPSGPAPPAERVCALQHPRPSAGATVQKIGISHIQMVGVLGIFKARGTQVFNDVVSRPSDIVGGSVTSLLPIKCALGSQIYGPFIVNMLLPPLALAGAALIMVPTAIVERHIRNRRSRSKAPVFKGKFNIPRCLAVHKLMRSPMTEADKDEWLGDFFPVQRLAGVGAFLLFFMYVANAVSVRGSA